MNIYYVYAYLRKDGTPYYIGKGCGYRAWQRHKNVKTPDNSSIVILENNLTEVGALAIERRMIAWHGREFNKTGILQNKTEGGDGCRGLSNPGSVPWNAGIKTGPQSAEWRKAISDSLKGKPKSDTQRKKQSDTMKGSTPWNKGVVGGQVAWNKGVPCPKNTGDNNSAKRPEVREKIRQKALERWARKKAQALLGSCLGNT
jgi:hypothetical protein